MNRLSELVPVIGRSRTLFFAILVSGTIVGTALAQHSRWREPGAQRRAVEGVSSESPPPAPADPADHVNEEQREERNRKRVERQQAERREYEAKTQPIKAELVQVAESILEVVPTQPALELKPSNGEYFGIPLDTGRKPFGSILVTAVGGIGTPASRISDVNLRRAAAVLAPMVSAETMNSMSEEDVAFLAGQSALAMEGAPLSVVIREVPVGREARVRQLAQQAQDVEALRAEAERASALVQAIENDILNVQYRISTGKGDAEALRKEREAFLSSYKSAHTIANDKRASVRAMAARVFYVEEPAP